MHLSFKNHSYFILMIFFMTFYVTSAKAFETNLPAPTKISEHVYAWIGPHGPPTKENQGFRMNLGMVIGNESVAIIESGYTPAMARDMIRHVSNITTLPIRYVINTNSRPDRYFGNTVFKENGAEIYAHEKEVAYMKKMLDLHIMGAEFSLKLAEGDVNPPELPNRSISEITKLDLGGITIELHPVPAAHTPAPLVVNIPSDKVVYAGDSIYSGRLLAIVEGGNARSWIDNFNYLNKTFPNSTFVPGHGKPAKLKEGFKKSTYDYLVYLDEQMTKAIDDGKDLIDALKGIDQTPWQYLENYDMLSGSNAHRVYIEREAAEFN